FAGWLLSRLMVRVRAFEHHLARLLPQAVGGRVESILTKLFAVLTSAAWIGASNGPEEGGVAPVPIRPSTHSSRSYPTHTGSSADRLPPDTNAGRWQCHSGD